MNDGKTSAFSENVDGLLRKLYTMGVDWLLVQRNGRDFPIRKDRLVSFTAMGFGGESIESMIDNKSSLLMNDDGYPDGKALVLGEDGLRIDDFTVRDEDLPAWWSVPMPILWARKGKTLVNPRTSDLFGPVALTDHERQTLLSDGELMIEVRGKRVYLSRMDGEFFFVEDVSCDYSLAEDVGWWAAVGKALLRRLKAQGFHVERKDKMNKADSLSEIVACSWDREILGYLEIKDAKEVECP